MRGGHSPLFMLLVTKLMQANSLRGIGILLIARYLLYSLPCINNLTIVLFDFVAVSDAV